MIRLSWLGWCMLLTLDPSKYWLILQLALLLCGYVCFHLYQGLLRKKLHLLCGFFLLAGRGILKKAQYSSCFEIQEAGWLDKYSLHIAVPEWLRLPSLSSLCTHSLLSMHIDRISNGCSGAGEEREEDREGGSSWGWGNMCWTHPKQNVKSCYILHPAVTQWHDGTGIPGTNSSLHFPPSPLFSRFLCYSLHHLSHCPNGHQCNRCTMHQGIKFWNTMCLVITVINSQNPIKSTVCPP